MSRLSNPVFAFACCCLLTGCATVGPVQKRAEQIRLPEVEFLDGQVAEVIVFLVEQVNRPSPPPMSIGMVREQDPKEDERKRMQFPELYRLCEGKTITLNARYCPILGLLAFAASYAELHAEFRNDQLVIVTKDGNVVMK